MRTIKLIGAILIFSIASITQAQISVNLNIGVEPQWGPSGYSNVHYYYIPDVESYYDVEKSVFIYNRNGVWVQSTSLPWKYRNYNLYNGYKVVLNNYRGNTPYVLFEDHRRNYTKNYRVYQRSIGHNPHNNNYNHNNFADDNYYNSDNDDDNDSYKNDNDNKNSNGKGNKNESKGKGKGKNK